MKRIFLTAAMSLLTIAGFASTTLPIQGKVVPADDPHIQYIGRICFQNPKQPRFTYPGVQINAGFSGTSLRMIAKPQSGYFMVQIDEADPLKLPFVVNGTLWRHWQQPCNADHIRSVSCMSLRDMS